MAKADDKKKRRGVQRLFDEAANAPETKAILKALEQPGIIETIEKQKIKMLDSMHRQSVTRFRDRQIIDYYSKVEAKALAPTPKSQQQLPATTTMITEAEFLEMVGRGTKSSAANSAWVLRRIHDAVKQGDKGLFPSFKVMGRNRMYHLDSVKAWMAQHPLDKN